LDASVTLHYLPESVKSGDPDIDGEAAGMRESGMTSPDSAGGAPGDAGAAYSQRYADASAIAERQRDLVMGWGTRVDSGASVLELGCADGFSTEYMTRSGLRVTGVDGSPDMLAAASSRFLAAGLEPSFLEADVNLWEPEESVDVVLGLMWTFFFYIKDPAATLIRLAAHTRVKLLADVNPRQTPIDEAVAAVRAAGFPSVTWRPFFVPQTRHVSPIAQRALRVAERTPLVRDVILRRKFAVVVKGEWT
jgi:SAM-dependent methyltransferase